jgi:terminase, large subunit
MSSSEENIKRVLREAFERFAPPSDLTISQWVEQNLYLPAGVTAFPGLMNLDMTPHARYILDAIGDERYKKITWISSVQTAKTQIEQAVAAYYMAEDACNILLYEPTEGLAKDVAVNRFNLIIEANECLSKLFESPSARNNDTEKVFPGGYLQFCSAQKESDLKSKSARIVMMDEVDTFETDFKDGGSPVSMARDRMTMQPRSKFILVGTPKTELSELFYNYNQSNMAVIEYACIHCGSFQRLEFGSKNTKYGLKWEEGSEGNGAWYQCKSCNEKIYNNSKPLFFSKSRLGYLTDKPEDSEHFGLWTNGLYSMSTELTWEKIAKQHVQVHRRSDRAARKTFTNSVLAEVFTENKYKVVESELAKRAITYNAQVPRWIGVLTAGIDINNDFISVLVLGHGKDEKVAVVDYKQFHGKNIAYIDPDITGVTGWSQLDEYLKAPFRHESGREIYIRTAFLDVADGQNPNGRKFVSKRMSDDIYGSQGTGLLKEADGYYGPFWSDKKTKMPIVPINSNLVKDEIMDRLSIVDHNTYRYITFPKNNSNITADFYKEMLIEKRTEKRIAGQSKVEWTCPKGARNEAWDCFCYAWTAFKRLYDGNMKVFGEVVEHYESPYVSPDAPQTLQTASEDACLAPVVCDSFGNIEPSPEATGPEDDFYSRINRHRKRF